MGGKDFGKDGNGADADEDDLLGADWSPRFSTVEKKRRSAELRMRRVARAAIDATGRGGSGADAPSTSSSAKAGEDASSAGAKDGALRDGGRVHMAVSTFLHSTPADLSWLSGPVSVVPAKKPSSTSSTVHTGLSAASGDVLRSTVVALAESEVR
eukprot:scaffold104454_cov28-Tisochrysis_lutea.AAC.3